MRESMRTPTLTFARARCTSQRRHPSLAPRLTPTLRLIRYGDKGIPPIIPPSSALQFEVELLSVQVTMTRLTRLEPKPGPNPGPNPGPGPISNPGPGPGRVHTRAVSRVQLKRRVCSRHRRRPRHARRSPRTIPRTSARRSRSRRPTRSGWRRCLRRRRGSRGWWRAPFEPAPDIEESTARARTLNLL